MFKIFKKYRSQRLKKQITLAYLSNPIASKDRNWMSDLMHINMLAYNVLKTVNLYEEKDVD